MNGSVRGLGAWILLVAACSTNGTVTGRVVDALDGTPVQGAAVTVQGTATSAQTGPDGAYRLDEVVPGQQHLAAERAGYVSLGEALLTVGERASIAAEDLRLVPKAPDVGLYARTKGAYAEVSAPESGIVRTVFTRPFDASSGTYAVSRAAFPDSRFSAVASGTRLVQFSDKPVRRAVLRSLRIQAIDRGEGILSRPEPTWVLWTGKDVTVPVERLSDTIALLTVDAPLGRYGLVQFGEGGEEYLNLLRVRPGGEGLVAPDGTYAPGSIEFAKAAEIARAWCGQSGRKKYDVENCAAAAPLLASTSSSCPGTLELPELGMATSVGALKLTDCATQLHYGFILAREDDGWFVTGVGVTDGGGDFAAGE